MSFLVNLHGVVAVALLCGLLFSEEAGVPLPFAPGELVLLAGGLLIAAGGLDPFVFVPLAVLACMGGSMLGYSWARAVGEHGLASLARRVHQERALERVAGRVRSAGPVGIAVSRLIPGLRIYTTLLAGALRVERRSFLLGMGPATVAWVIVFVALGALVGLPVEHFLSQIQKLAVQGAILVGMGLGGYFAIRRTPPSSGSGLVRMPRPARILLAIAIDVGVVTSVITGLLALGRRFLGIGLGSTWLDAVIAFIIVVIFYVVITRRGTGATVGEALMQTTYVSDKHVPLHPQGAWRAAQALVTGTPDELRPTVDMLRAVGEPERLRLVLRCLDSPRSLAELAALSGTQEFEVLHHLDRLQASGVIVGLGEPGALRFSVRAEVGDPLVRLLAAPPAVAAGAPAAAEPLVAPVTTDGVAGPRREPSPPEVAPRL